MGVCADAPHRNDASDFALRGRFKGHCLRNSCLSPFQGLGRNCLPLLRLKKRRGLLRKTREYAWRSYDELELLLDGICFEGEFETEQMPEAQIAAGKELVADIVGRYPSIVVGRHSDFGQTACPGKNFTFDEIVSGNNAEPVNNAEEADEPSAWAKDLWAWAIEKGLLQGDGSEGYRWHENVTREELAVILERASKLF